MVKLALILTMRMLTITHLPPKFWTEQTKLIFLCGKKKKKMGGGDLWLVGLRQFYSSARKSACR